jgi:hypothetical protein
LTKTEYLSINCFVYESACKDAWSISQFTHLPQQVIKYGVIEVQHLVKDLEDWSSLYIGGRMQKPVVQLLHNPRVQRAQLRNFRSALTAALLLLPGEFSTEAGNGL